METIETGGMIRLGQFLKYAGLVDSGADARALVVAGAVEVDGQTETRRGRQLHGGEVVTLVTDAGERSVRVGDAAPRVG